jgi:hypothetical protein
MFTAAVGSLSPAMTEIKYFSYVIISVANI